ncbi:MAG TPA: STAS domain-containing protein [Bryobacteraceae bacterium]|nr:STAS domain-containing protein [Bryobacteraceae bacterium]
MPLTLERDESRWLIRMEGQVTLTSAGELKQLLLEWRAARKDLEFDLHLVEEIDIPIMQLLWAATQEARREGVRVVASGSEPAVAAAREAGFAQMPGFPLQD